MTARALPNIDATLFHGPDLDKLPGASRATHKPRILLLYGSLRERSYSRFLTLEAERILQALGAETRIFESCDLPLPDAVPVTLQGARVAGNGGLV